MPYLDSHAHIMDEAFAEDFDQVIQRIVNAQIDHVLIMCTNMEEAKRAIVFRQSDPERFQVAVGLHPEDIDKITEADLQALEVLARDENISLIGEIGLDYYWRKDNKEAQKELFKRQISIARSVHKPISIHARDAVQDTLDILKENPIKAVMHSFSGSVEMMKEFEKIGCYISLGGPVTFKNSRHAKEVAAVADVTRLLTETDCPYMAPEPVRGTRNEPCNIPYIAKKMAELRNMSISDFTSQVEANYQRFLERTDAAH